MPLHVCFAEQPGRGGALRFGHLLALCCMHTSGPQAATCATGYVKQKQHSPATMTHALGGMPHACGSADSANVDFVSEFLC
jgi:hypothetical protein